MVRLVSVTVTRALLAVFLLLVPAQGVAALDLRPASDPIDAPLASEDCGPSVVSQSCLLEGIQDFLVWSERVPVDELAGWSTERVFSLGGTFARAPAAVPGYDTLPDEAQRAAWRAWVLRAAYDETHLPNISQDPMRWDAADNPVPGDAVAPALGPPKGLRAVWSMDAHGWPIGVFAADDAGAFFLVTDLGVLRFPGPSQESDWFLKPGGIVESAQATDVNQDGTADLVLGVDSFFYWEDSSPSIVVVDGKNGAVLWSGFGGEERLWSWTLTDVNGDGRLDVLGLDLQDRIAAAQLDGTPLFTFALPTKTGAGESAVVAYASLMYSPMRGNTFADVDGDGTKDVILARGYRAYAYASLPFVYAVAEGFEGQVAAYRGTDGSLLWETTTELGARWDVPNVLATGDLDGDGKEDALLEVIDFVYFLALAVLAFALVQQYTTGYAVLSGEDGAPLTRDDRRHVFACAVLCAPIPGLGTVDFEPFGIFDLDGDGAAEVVAFANEYTSEGQAIVGRRPGSIEGGASVEAYRKPVGFPHYDDWDARLLIRQADADDKPDVILYVLGLDRDNDGNVKSYESRVATITKTAVVNVPTSKVVAQYDIVESTGQAFGWTVDEARWVPIDQEGKTTGTGPRILEDLDILARHDMTGDGVDDLVLESLTSVLFVNGATGSIERELQRPLTRSLWGAEREGDTIRLIERDQSTGSYFVVDLESGQTMWEVTEAMQKDGYAVGFRDFSGDGLLDMAISYYDDDYNRFLDVLDRRAGSTILTLDYETRNARFADALPERTGEEIVMLNYGGETDILELYTVPESAPRWTYDLGGYGSVIDSDPGHLLISANQDGDYGYRVLSGSGTVLATIKETDGHYLSSAAFVSTTDDEAVDLAVIQGKEETDPREYSLTIYDGTTWAPASPFGLSPAFKPEPDGWTSIGPALAKGRMVGDWDGDGRGDFVLQEQLVTTVRSGATGALLAVAPSRSVPATAFDVNDDGALELGVESYAGRLSLFMFDASVEGLPPEVGAHLVIDSPALDIVPDDDDGGGLPGFQLGFALVALALFLLRRRSRGPAQAELAS